MAFGIMSDVRIHRLLKLIRALQSDSPFRREMLAKELDISRRTLYRDLKLLEEAGVSSGHDPLAESSGRSRESYLPPVALTVEESLVLLLLARKMLDSAMVPNPQATVNAAVKLESMLPHAIVQELGSILQNIDIRLQPTSTSSHSEKVTEAFQQAIRQRCKVETDYLDYSIGEKISTVIHPYRLSFLKRGWYIIGYSTRHDAVRTFKAVRVLRYKLLSENFEPDDSFSLEDYLGNAWELIPEGQCYRVIIRFLPMVSGNVAEVNWHKTQRVTYQDDGSIIFEVDVDGLREISWWVLGYGDQAVVLEPPELREMVAARVEKMSRYYSVPSSISSEQ